MLSKLENENSWKPIETGEVGVFAGKSLPKGSLIRG